MKQTIKISDRLVLIISLVAVMMMAHSTGYAQEMTFGQMSLQSVDSLFEANEPEVAEIVDTEYVSPASANLEAVWDRANTEYVNGNFNGAIVEYNKILDTGNASARLYYNLANAYFKVGQIGSSILNYRRAYLLAPSDRDISYNLEIAQSQIQDKIAEVPMFFGRRLIIDLRSSLSSNNWALMAVVVFALAAIFTLVYLLASGYRVRKIGFVCAIVCCAVFALSLSFSFAQRRVVVLENEAVIMSSAVAVKSSPDRSSKDIFILHEGTSLNILNTLGEWSEIVIADGNKGWLPSSSFEKVSIAH